VFTALQAPFELQSRRSIRQFEPAETQVGPNKIARRYIQREYPSRNVSEAVVQLRQYQTVAYVDAELISASTSACMTAEATPGATRTGFRYALVSTTRHPDIDEPALAIPNRIDDRAGTRHSTGRPVLEPVDGASC
jgi:hypothetical protein